MVVSARQRVQMLVPSALVRPYGFRCEGCPRKRVRLSDCRAHSPGHSDGEAGRQCARSITLHTAELRRPRQMPTESRTPLWPRKAAGEARSTEQTSWNRIFRRMDGEEMPKSRNALKMPCGVSSPALGNRTREVQELTPPPPLAWRAGRRGQAFFGPTGVRTADSRPRGPQQKQLPPNLPQGRAGINPGAAGAAAGAKAKQVKVRVGNVQLVHCLCSRSIGSCTWQRLNGFRLYALHAKRRCKLN